MMGWYILGLIAVAVISAIVFYPLGHDIGYAEGRRDEGQEQARIWKEEQKQKWRTEAARKRMEANDGKTV